MGCNPSKGADQPESKPPQGSAKTGASQAPRFQLTEIQNPSPAPKPEDDEVIPGFRDALRVWQPQFRLQVVKEKQFYLSINNVKHNACALEIAACDSATTAVYSKEITDKDLVAQVKNMPADQLLKQLEYQMKSNLIKLHITERDFKIQIALETKSQKSSLTFALEKKKEALNFQTSFLEVLLSHHRKSRLERDDVFREKEMLRNETRRRIGERMEELKEIETILEPLRKSHASDKSQQVELQAKIDLLQKKIYRLKNPSSFTQDNLYPGGVRRYPLHIPHAANHVPTLREPNRAAMQMVKMHYEMRAKVKDSIPNEPMEAELKALLSRVPNNAHEDIVRVLKRIDDWDFDVFALQQHTGDGPLFMTTYALLHKYGLVSHFKFDEETLINFLLAVESGYHPNAYHNATHAADVLQVTHYIIGPGGMRDQLKLTSEDCLAGLLSAAIHDFDHPGFNNNFHVRTNAYLATLYNDRSVLENHHCSSIYELMKDDKYNIFKSLNDEQRKDVRDTMVEMILSTDMGNHAKIFQTFKKRLQDDSEWTKRDDIRLALSIAIKMADISNCARPAHLYKKWADLIAQEFYNQGDVELRLKLTISPFMDRRKHDTDFAKGQVSFMNYIVIPLFEAGAEMLPHLEFTVGKIQENKECYVDHM